MLIILSPTKTFAEKAKLFKEDFMLPTHLNKSEILMNELKMKTIDELIKLMNISPKLAQLNFERFQQWNKYFNIENSQQAIFAYRGEVFNGLDADTLKDSDIRFAQKHLIILSGLYGTLRPLDLIQPYRLEMGTKASFAGRKNLYEFWKETITSSLQQALTAQNDNILINLASNEYFKTVDTNAIDAHIISPQFKEYKNGVYKIVTIYTKKARGLMTRFILQNRISDPEQIKLFDLDGYYYNDLLTTNQNSPVFTRN